MQCLVFIYYLLGFMVQVSLLLNVKCSENVWKRFFVMLPIVARTLLQKRYLPSISFLVK